MLIYLFQYKDMNNHIQTLLSAFTFWGGLFLKEMMQKP